MENTIKPFVYDWKYGRTLDADGNYPIIGVVIHSDRRLDKKEALLVLREEQKRYKPSNYKSFNPVAGISHWSVVGWTGLFKTILYGDIETFNLNKGKVMFSEPTHKDFKKHKKTEFIYTDKDRKNYIV
jgi:hypothetical protein